MVVMRSVILYSPIKNMSEITFSKLGLSIEFIYCLPKWNKDMSKKISNQERKNPHPQLHPWRLDTGENYVAFEFNQSISSLKTLTSPCYHSFVSDYRPIIKSHPSFLPTQRISLEPLGTCPWQTGTRRLHKLDALLWISTIHHSV